jgi:hypothetical protein
MANAVYNGNYRSQNLRTHGTPDAFQFGAASDGAAATISAAIVTAKGIYGKQVSLYKQLYRAAYGTTPPAGSVYSLKAFLSDGVNKVQRVNARNAKSTFLAADISKLFLGVAGGTFGFTALSAPAIILPSTTDCTLVNGSIIQKH